MIIPLKVTYGDIMVDGAGNRSAAYSGYGFDTEQMDRVPYNGTWQGAFLDELPQNIDYPEDIVLAFDCQYATPENEYEGRAIYHNRATQGIRYEVAPQCTACGYEPPAPSCDLTEPVAEVVGRQVTITGVTGNHGELRYALDGSTAQQEANVFEDLADGEHTVTVFDAGVPGCEKAVTFTIEGEPADPPLPTGPAESLSLVLRPVWEVVEGYPAGTVLLLELWVETAHHAGDHRKVYEAQKKVGADGVIGFQLDRMLCDQLEHVAPALGAASSSFVTRALATYFTRVRVLHPVTQRPGVAVNGPMRTALLAGLPSRGNLLTTQPLRKKMAPGQPEYLYYLNPLDGPEQVVVRRELTTSTGTVDVLTEPIALLEADIPAGLRLLCIPAALGQLSGTYVQLRVGVADEQGEYLASPMTYQLIRPRPRQRVFLFDNPRGGLDTLVATGPGRNTLDGKTEPAERASSWDTPPAAPTRSVFDLSLEVKLQVGTGWLSPAQLKWLQALMRSRVMWRQQGTALQPVVLNKRSLPYQRDVQVLEGFTLEYSLGNEQLEWEEMQP